MDVWLFEYDGDADLANADTKEVAGTKWLKTADIRKLYDEGELVDTLEYFFDKVEKV